VRSLYAKFQRSSFRESGWQSGRELDFYPSNPGSTPARVPTTKKRISKPPSVPLIMTKKKSQGVLKKLFKKTYTEEIEVTDDMLLPHIHAPSWQKFITSRLALLLEDETAF